MRLSGAPQVKTAAAQLTDRWWPAARLGPLDSWETFGPSPAPEENVTDDNSSSRIWQLASAKSYGDRLDLCQQRLRRPSIRLLFSKRTPWQPEWGDEFCWITAPNLNHKVGEKFLLLPNQRELLNDNTFLKNLSFSFFFKWECESTKSVIFRSAKLAGSLIRIQTGNPDQSCWLTASMQPLMWAWRHVLALMCFRIAYILESQCSSTVLITLSSVLIVLS